MWIGQGGRCNVVGQSTQVKDIDFADLVHSQLLSRTHTREQLANWIFAFNMHHVKLLCQKLRISIKIYILQIVNQNSTNHRTILSLQTATDERVQQVSLM